MKRFVFRLARLEKLRKARKREARIALAGALAVVRERREERLDREREARESNETTLPDGMEGNPRHMQQLAEWRRGIGRLAEFARVQEREAVGRARNSEDLYREAARDHRVLELLRERRRREWQDEVRREEQKFLDETHLLRLRGKRSRDARHGDKS